jgi:hypothetical protein
MQDEVAVVPPTPPTLTLLGPAAVTVCCFSPFNHLASVS